MENKPKQIDIIGKIYNGIIKGILLGYTLVALQGSARAGKSYQIMIFLIMCCLDPKMANQYMYAHYISAHKNWEERKERGEEVGSEPLLIQREHYHVSVVRLALPSLKRSIFRDFVEIMVNMGCYDPRRMNKTEMIYTFENGSVMEFFATADNEQKVRGSKRDILFVNEANELNSEEFRQLRMRSECFSIVDFNPSFTEEHWLFPLLKEPRTYHFISTFVDNPFLSNAIKDEIMSYKYTNPALWQIFGMGEFAIVEGLVFPKDTWDVVDKTTMPIDIKYEERIGIDIGFSGKGDPTAVVRTYTAKIDGIKHMWLEEIVYEKGLNEKQLAYRLRPFNHIKKYIDSANPLYIQNLEDNGIGLLYPVVKYANSILDGLTKMQGYKMHILRGSVNIEKEFNNYCWMKDRHEAYTNTPIDKFNHCFAAGTMINTADGAKRIEDIRVGDIVYTSYGMRPVLETFGNGIQEVWDIEYTVDGIKITMSVTPDHKIKTENEWKQVRNLKKGDKIYLFKSLTEKNTTSTMENAISPEGEGGYMLSCGNTSMVECQKDSMCITRMRTRLTTQLRILKSYLCMTTCRFMLRSTCRILNSLLKLGRTWPRLSNVLRVGTVVKKVESGIVSTLSSKFESNMNALVNNAEKLTRLSNRQDHDSAQMRVNRNGAERQGLIMKQEYALCAEKSLSRIDSQAQSLAEEHVLGNIKLLRKHYERTYNFMVCDRHEYFAEGVLVSNCIDAIRYATMSDRVGRASKRRYTKGELRLTF